MGSKKKKAAAEAVAGQRTAAAPSSPRRAVANAAAAAITAEAFGNDAQSHAVRAFLGQRQKPSQLGAKIAAAAEQKRKL